MGKRLTQEEAQQRLDKNFAQKVTLISDYVNRRTKVKLRCNECGYEWEAAPASVMYSDYTHRCPNCGTKDGKYVKCAYCGKEIYRSPSQLEKSKSGFYYCSHECGNLHKNQLREEAGEWSNSITSYRSRALKAYPHKCAVCNYDEDERILQIHHRDCNRNNNTIENLVVLCPNCHWKITLGLYDLTDDNQLIEK